MPIPHLYSNLARQGLAKSITHGYAQSVVAATHPQAHLSSQSRPRFGLNRRASKVGSHQYYFQNAFHSSTQASSTIVLEGRGDKTDGGLDAYFEAWRKHHVSGEPEKEWTQFQFAKRIEWKPLEDEQKGVPEEREKFSVERPYSASAVDDIKKVELAEEEKAALATIDAAIEREIKSRNDKAIFEAELSVVAGRVPTPPIASIESPAISTSESIFDRSPTSSFNSLSTASELQSQSYAEHLMKLSHAGRHAEIPAVFEAMLVAGIQPTTAAYNALMDAAIYLPTERIQVVPKALDVYSDMLRRKVLPNTETYQTLMNLLSSRSIEVSSQKQSLEEKRVRYGGMNVPGKFMFPSNEVEFEILAEDDRLDLAIKLFDASITYRKNRSYPPETYHKLIQACSAAGRVPDMIRLYEHMESNKIVPLAATFPPMIKGFTQTGDLVSAVECYNEYKRLAVAHDRGEIELRDRQDALVYASVVKAYIVSDKLQGATKFYSKITDSYRSDAMALNESILLEGFVQGLLEQRKPARAFEFAGRLSDLPRARAMSAISAAAADAGEKDTALQAYTHVPQGFEGIAEATMAMLALSAREFDLASVQKYWSILSHPKMSATPAFIDATTMYGIAMIGSGYIEEGVSQTRMMFHRIKSFNTNSVDLEGQLQEAVQMLNQFMIDINEHDSYREVIPETPIYQQNFAPTPYAAPPPPTFEDTFDPYAASTDMRGSGLIADDLERGPSGRNKSSRLNEAMGRFRNIRRAGRHPRYITYAKLISAAARENRVKMVHDIHAMAQSDVPLLTKYPIVRYGWVSILDAMVGACLTLGDRIQAARFHQELLDMGAAPTANTFGLYITTLKESTKTFDEATEAVKIFHRAKAEGVEPSSFLYNALIGKLGKARRIDDCLFYFAEMRGLGIRPTSVTYGTIVNALCRVSDEKFAEQLFEEMESMPNYKARPAPYNSMMQFYLTTKRDKSKVLEYYERMKKMNIEPTNHTYKLLVDTYATLEPINIEAAEAVLDVIRSTGQKPDAIHYSSLIHAKGCVLHDMDGARAIFDSVIADSSIRPQAALFQALFESMVANHRVNETEAILNSMNRQGVEITPYIANALIHGWTNENNIAKSSQIYNTVGYEKREPSTYEAMTRAYLAAGDRLGAKAVVQEMLARGYPSAVSNKIVELVENTM